MFTLFHNLKNALVNLFIPNVCCVCGEHLVGNELAICKLCIDRLPVTRFETWSDNPMFVRVKDRLPVSSAFAGFFFRDGEVLRKLIHHFKYHDNFPLAESLGRELGRIALAAHFTDGFHFIVPVPLHPAKFLLRGYNQSFYLAKGFADVTGLEVRDDVISRALYRGSQTKLSAVDRFQNVKSNFVLGEGASRVVGKGVIIIDDVFTTGATLESCADPLRALHDVRIGLVTLGYRGD